MVGIRAFPNKDMDTCTVCACACVCVFPPNFISPSSDCEVSTVPSRSGAVGSNVVALLSDTITPHARLTVTTVDRESSPPSMRGKVDK